MGEKDRVRVHDIIIRLLLFNVSKCRTMHEGTQNEVEGAGGEQSEEGHGGVV